MLDLYVGEVGIMTEKHLMKQSVKHIMGAVQRNYQNFSFGV